MDDDAPLASLFSTRHLERIRELGSNNGCPAVQAKPAGPEAKRTRASERDESLIGGARCNTKEEFLDEANVGDVVVALGEVEGYQTPKGKVFKKFKQNLVSFWDNLVVECQHGPLFNAHSSKSLLSSCAADGSPTSHVLNFCCKNTC
ncbi:STAG - like 2 [Theobroma cacao]|nr:STAG - like 2 [Theobroma cacao]